MAGTLFGIVFFLFCFTWHVVLWRFSDKSLSMRRLVRLFVTIFIIFCLILPALIFDPLFGLSKLTRTEFLHGILLFFSLSATYIIFYPGVEFESPSNKILMTLFFAGKDGLSEKYVRSLVSKENSTKNRIDELVESGKINLRDKKLILTPSGSRLFKIFTVIGRIYKIEIR